MSDNVIPMAKPPQTVTEWPTRKQIDEETGILDDLLDIQRRMRSALERLQVQTFSSKAQYIEHAKAVINEFESDFKRDAELREADDWRDPRAPKSWFDENDGPNKAEVAKMLAAFVGAFPGKISNPAAFGAALLNDVLEEAPSYAELEATCRELRRKSKTLPSLAEFLEELTKNMVMEEDRLVARWYTIGNYNDLVAAVEKAVVEEAARAEREAAEKAEREEQKRIAAEKQRADEELRAQPLEAGDRVRHKTGDYDRSPGTIVGAVEDGFHVCFDKARGDYVDAGSLERLIPGDYGFEIVEADRDAIEKRLTEYRRRLQRIQRPVVGDRVTDDIDWTNPKYPPPHGAGTVIFAGDFDDDYDDGFTIQFDNGKLGVNYMARQLNRLLPDDPEFVRSEEVVAAWRAWEQKQVHAEAGEKSAVSTKEAEEAVVGLISDGRTAGLAIGNRVNHPDIGIGTVWGFEGDLVDVDFGETGGIISVDPSELEKLPPRFEMGDRVSHEKFGPGTVTAVDGNKLGVVFDTVGWKPVVESFVEPWSGD
jgi:hypothetical protein